MATVQTILDGPRNVIIKVDGLGPESDAKILTVSNLSPPCTRVRLYRITYNLEDSGTATDFQLLWDATTPLLLINLYGGNDADMDFSSFGGLPNNAGAGVTGDVLLDGGLSNAPYSMVLHFIKSDPTFE